MMVPVVPFSVACGLHYGGVELAHVSGTGWLEPMVLKTMDKVRWIEDSSLSEHPECACITIELKDNTNIAGLRLFASGTPGAPLSDTALIGKFLACLRFAGISESVANNALAHLLQGEFVPNGFHTTRVLSRLWTHNQ